jgi:site-specific recombinase XerD
MEPRGLPLSALDEEVIASFVGHFQTCDCYDERVGSHERALARVRVFCRYLQEVGVVARPVATIVDEPLVTAFVTWMRQQRGAKEWTVKAYTRVIRGLLVHVGHDRWSRSEQGRAGRHGDEDVLEAARRAWSLPFQPCRGHPPSCALVADHAAEAPAARGG